MQNYSRYRLGVLALQGGFQKHLDTLSRLGCRTAAVKEPRELAGLDGLLIPGGESTTIGMLMQRFGMLDELSQRMSAGFPVFGTCAGAILLADDIENSEQIRLGGLPICIRRNAYGRQIESFEADLEVTGLSTPLRGVFIRAPQIIAADPAVTILASYEGKPVVVRKDNLMAATFHPELTGDNRLHKLFLESVVG